MIYPIHPDLRNIIFLDFFLGVTSNTSCISILIFKKREKKNIKVQGEKTNTSGVFFREKRSNQILFAEMFKAYNKARTITALTAPGKHKLIRPDRESIPRYRAIKTQSSAQNLMYSNVHEELHYFICQLSHKWTLTSTFKVRHYG